MNQQEIFDTVVTHLRKQGKKAVVMGSEGPSCMYRSPDGLKCAAGCLIPDRDYLPEFEGVTINDGDHYPVVKYFSSKFDEDGMELISELQTVHDFMEPQDWELRWESIAIDHGLKLLPKGKTSHD